MGDDFERRQNEALRRMDDLLQRPEAYTGDTVVQPKGEQQRAQAPATPARPRRRRAAPMGAGKQAVRTPGRMWRRVRLVLLLLVVCLVGAVGVAYWQARALSQAIAVGDARGPSFALPMLGGVSVLLIGVDERLGAPEEGVRSDTLIVAHLNGPGGWANLLSIPRDTMAELPLPEGPVAQKINTAYGTGYARAEELYGPGTTPQQGGMALAAQTTERFLGQSIQYTAQINFDGFAKLIDALGGITIDVPVYILDTEYPTPDFGYTTIEFQPGVQRMNGETALIYARTRHSDSDFDRGKRQQQVLRAMIDEFRGRSRMQQLFLLPRLREALRGTVVTTVPVARPDVLLGLGMLSRLDPATIGQFRISPDTVTLLQEDAFANLYWDAEGVRAQARLLTSAPSEAREAATVQVFNGTDAVGLAAQVGNQLAAEGFTITPPGDAPPAEYATTIIYDRTNKPLTAERLGRVLGAEVVRDPLPAGLVSEADLVVVLGRNAQ